MIVDFIAQLEWRFAHVSQYPLKFARYVHPRTTKADRLRMATNFCSKRRCFEKDFAGKILNLFEKRPKALLRDVDSRCAIIAWISAFRWTNMHMERLLAQTFHWASAQDGRFEDAERLVAEGFMGQLFSDHLSLGRDDPRSTTRAQLKEQGVLTRVAMRKKQAERKKRRSKPASGFIVFCNAEAAKRDTSVPCCTWVKDIAPALWSALPDSRKEFEKARAVQQWVSKVVLLATEVDNPKTSRTLGGQPGARVGCTVVEAEGDRAGPSLLIISRRRWTPRLDEIMLPERAALGSRLMQTHCASHIRMEYLPRMATRSPRAGFIHCVCHAHLLTLAFVRQSTDGSCPRHRLPRKVCGVTSNVSTLALCFGFGRGSLQLTILSATWSRGSF